MGSGQTYNIVMDIADHVQGQSTALAAEKLSGPASELTARFLVASTEAARLSLHTGAAYLHAGKTVLDLVIYAAPRTCPDFAWPWIVAAVGCTKVVFPVLLTLAFVKGFAAWILQAFVGLVG
ncbi:hypothetical protein P171DRAFT_432543 [Karstenula rhodostoma CBS 690.94]|uniref:Uncharacterized protein n=1 Tax=Karstenula rhodostoma CBS 690.94 TaxID=1392251 RepID=A0A9P4UCM9_9PLEO|nr:hypothetical protein P171DRAFT_432543 [Karstenula rhodostoma CBS 690.94]